MYEDKHMRLTKHNIMHGKPYIEEWLAQGHLRCLHCVHNFPVQASHWLEEKIQAKANLKIVPL